MELNPVDYAAFTTRNARSFLQSRGIGFDALSRMAVDQGFGDARVLLTSSPVHGIATSTSDIDLICVTPQAVDGFQMAAQIHRDGHHFELLPFSAADTERAFIAMGALAELALPQRLAGYAQWDDTQAVRRKYLERMVYGVDMSEAAPLLSHLPALARVVAAQDYDLFCQSHVCAWLACRAGERGAAQGYLLNACLAAMSCVLSMGGWVLSNKKWTLRRWHVAAERAMHVVEPGLQAKLTRLWTSLAVASPPTTEALDQFDALRGQLATALEDRSQGVALFSQAKATPKSPLDARSAFLLSPDGRVRLARITDLEPAGGSLDELRSLSTERASGLLRCARSGALSFSLQAASPAQATREDDHVAAL